MVPIGSIVLWFGEILDIPAGWAHCNGSNGTPDLRNKFPMGAGGGTAPGETGGALTHGHLFSGLVHSHEPLATHDCPGGGGLLSATVQPSNQLTNQVAASGTVGPAEELPPFHALAYMMRLS